MPINVTTATKIKFGLKHQISEVTLSETLAQEIYKNDDQGKP